MYFEKCVLLTMIIPSLVPPPPPPGGPPMYGFHTVRWRRLGARVGLYVAFSTLSYYALESMGVWKWVSELAEDRSAVLRAPGVTVPLINVPLGFPAVAASSAPAQPVRSGAVPGLSTLSPMPSLAAALGTEVDAAGAGPVARTWVAWFGMAPTTGEGGLGDKKDAEKGGKLA